MLIDIVNIYLSVRRDAGFKLDEVEKYLSSYANFAMARGDTHIAGKTAIEWASQASSENERSRRSDVLMVSSMVAGIAVHHISIPTKKCRN
jgi:hypothetical protein